MDSDQQEMPGRKRLMQRRLENRSKGRRVERTCKAYRKRYGNLCKRRGGRCGKACMDVKAEQPGAKSYKEFLKRFAVVREEVSVDMDSFDYGFYMYGLQHYGNMPLIEENEFREAKRSKNLLLQSILRPPARKTCAAVFE